MKFENSPFLLAGAAAGFCAGIMFAPASGKYVRKLIVKKTSAGKKAVTQTASQATKQIAELVDRGNSALCRGKQSVRKVAHQAGRVLLSA